MKTVAEINSAGKVARVFHRNANSAWTHVPGQRYRYRGGRHGAGWVEMACPCPVVNAEDADARGRVPRPTGATQRRLQSGGGSP
jgi:hypothetical protein